MSAEERERAARAEDPAETFARTLRFIATRDDQAGESDQFLAANALELHPEFWGSRVSPYPGGER